MNWTNELLWQVWSKGRIVPGYDQNSLRLDACGAWISRVHYGDRNSELGWEVDHITPSGGDTIGNLRPLQWQNNVAKSDGKLVCVVKASNPVQGF